MNFLTASVSDASSDKLSMPLILSAAISISGCNVNDVNGVVDEDITDDIFVDVAIPGDSDYRAALSALDLSTRQSAMVTQMRTGHPESLSNLDHNLRLSDSGEIINLADGRVITSLWELSGTQMFRNAIWSRRYADVIFGTIGLKFVSLNIATREINVIRDVGQLDGFVSTGDDIHLDNPWVISAGDQYAVLSDVSRGGKTVIVIDIRSGEKRASIDDVYSHAEYRVIPYGTADFAMDISISSSGDHIIIQGADGYHLFDGELAYISKLVKRGDSDLVSVAGDEVRTASTCRQAEMEQLADGRALYLTTDCGGSAE